MRLTLSIFAMLLLCTSQAFGQRTWNAGTNDFGTHANWTGSTGSFTGTNQAWDIGVNLGTNMTGTNRAILSTAVGNVQRDVRIGDSGGQGELEVTATGSMTVTRDLRLARAGLATGQGTMTVDGGSVTVNEGIFVGQSDNPLNPTTFTLNSGTVTNIATANAVLNVAHQSNNRGNLVINGGTFTTQSAVMANGSAGISSASLTVTGGSLTTTVGGITFASGANVGAATPTNGAKATVNLSGTGAISTATNMTFGSGSNSESSLTISGGTMTAGTSMSFGFGDNSAVNLNMTGGTLNATTNFLTFGQGAGSTTSVTMSGGNINTDRLSFGNNSTAAASLNMSGGAMNITANSASGNRGALVMGSATPDLDLSGLALISAERLNNNLGGSIDLSGFSILDLKGSTIFASPGVLANNSPTFSMTSAHLGLSPWASTLGTINFSSTDSLLRVAGDVETIDGVLVTDPDFNVNFVNLFNDAIANNKFTHNVVGGVFNVGFDGMHSFVQVTSVPEPSSLALLGVVGGVLSYRRFRRKAVGKSLL